MTFTIKRHTDELTEQSHRLESALCPLCGISRPTYRDLQKRRYFARHQQSGQSTWCAMSGKAVMK